MVHKCTVHESRQVKQSFPHLHLLQTAEEAARRAPERPAHVDDGPLLEVDDVQVERAEGAEALPGQAVRVLGRHVHGLAHAVLHGVLEGIESMGIV